jgi:hypothetical protein
MSGYCEEEEEEIITILVVQQSHFYLANCYQCQSGPFWIREYIYMIRNIYPASPKCK